jgi:dimethylamine/trimethylamine dehydrogenase
MTRPARYDVLFEPIQIGPRTMKNRFYQTPHCTGFGDVFPGAQASHRAMKAEGGWAVVNTEATTIGPEYDWAGQMSPSRLWDDDDIRNWSLLTEKAHEHDALVGIQLHAGGGFLTGFDSRLPGRHLHNRLEEAGWLGSVIAMDKQDIRGVQRLYVEAALRAQRAGFDIINVWGGESASLPVQYLMNIHNQRTDEYGGSLENRARFWMETLEQVREALDDDMVVCARFCIDSLHEGPGGIKVDDEGVGFIELADHLVDFWDVQVGGEHAELWIKDAGPSRFYPENAQAPWVRKIRPYTKKPIVGVGRFTNPDTMVEAILSGQLDIIGAARPSISDPFLPKKIEEGRFEDIRECIGCNVCVSRVNARWHLICTQNSTAGEEYRRGWHPERLPQTANPAPSILIVGAGAAGLECAIDLGKRGFQNVHLVDAAPQIGGHVDWISTLPGMNAWRRIVEWRTAQLAKLPVQVMTGRRLEVADILDYGAENVVVAIGAEWDGQGVNGITHHSVRGADSSMANVATPEQILRDGKVLPGSKVAILDTEGYYMGSSLAQKLREDGYEVTLVTHFPGPAPYFNFTGENVFMRPLLEELGVTVVTEHVITDFTDGQAVGHSLISEKGASWETDSLVLVTQRNARTELYKELVEAVQSSGDEIRVFQIGDCVAPRMLVADAIFDGARLAREFDDANPEEARRYIRERRLIGATDADYDAVLQPGTRG